MSKILYNIYLYIRDRPVIGISVAFIFLLLSVFALRGLKFNEDIARIFPTDEKNSEATKIAGKMSFTDKIAIIFSKSNEKNSDDGLISSATAFTDTISNFQAYYTSIQGMMDEETVEKAFQFVYDRLPLYLDSADYKEIETNLNRDSIHDRVLSNYDLLTSIGSGPMKQLVIDDPLQLSFLALSKLEKFQSGDDYDVDQGFLFSKDHDKLFLFLTPTYRGNETEHNKEFAKHLERIQSDLSSRYPEVKISYFGASLIAVANAEQIQKDILNTVAISTVLLMLLLIFYYRNWLLPIIVMIPSIFGGISALLLLMAIKSDISAISLSISAILIGITIDYALHYLTHSKGSADQRKLFKDVSEPLMMSSSTTAIAFLCLLFVKSEVLVDLGIFASAAVMFSAIFTLILLPHIYRGKEIRHAHIIDKIAKYPFEKNKVLVSLTSLLIIVSLFFYGKTSFDGDLTKINFIPENIREAEKSLNSDNQINKNLFAVIYGNNQDSLLATNESLYHQLESIPEVENIQSISTLIPSEKTQSQKIADWNKFWNTDRVKKLIQELESVSTHTGFIENTHAKFYKLIQKKEFPRVRLANLKEIDQQLYDEFVNTSEDQIIISNLLTLAPKDRDVVVDKIENIDLNDHITVVDRQELTEQYLDFIIQDFNTLVTYSFVAVLLILFAFYRRIELVLAASIPIGLTGLITAGLMGIFQIPFNVFSMIVCTLVFGHGIDFSIFMTSALQKQYTLGKDEMPIYRTSILLAVLTTILAIGALIFAKHPALKSISAIALIGVTSAILVTFVLYPIVFKFLFFNRVSKGKSPVTLWLAIQSTLFFLYFAVASIFVSLAIRITNFVLPTSNKAKLILFGKWMSTYMKSVLYLKPTVSKKIFDEQRLNHTGQAVLIANHTSFLDTLSMAMLCPKGVFVVNNWVSKSPIFGKAVRLLGFYQVDSGISSEIEQVASRIGSTFSLLVFPEGTRSRTSTVQRFHKGAFFFSEELNLPIVPIYLHGNSDTLPKGDFIIYDNFSHIHVGEPIMPSDKNFGESYLQKTKTVSRDFKQKFFNIRCENENADYFKQKLFLNFLYKDHNIRRRVKKDFDTNKLIYRRLMDIIPQRAKIAHVTEDFGQIDFLLVHQSADRHVKTFNLDEHRRAVSSNSHITKKYAVTYASNIHDIWNNSEFMLISHQSEWTFSIPASISEIILLCCDFELKNLNFEMKVQEENLKMYVRVENN